MKSIKYILLPVLLAMVLIETSCVSKKAYQTEVTKANTDSVKASNYAALNQQLNSALSNDQALINKQQIQITQLQDQLKVTLVNEVVFSEGGYLLNTSGKATLASIAPTLAGLTGQQIVVQGYTDNEPIVGELKTKYATNLDLSTARANNVTEYLISKGVPGNIISSQGFGEQRPVAPNDTPAGRAKNRRVEIVIKAAGQ
jgi:chemotaxis protein MotB